MKNRKLNIKRTSAQTEKIVVILIALVLNSFNIMAQGYTNVATQNVMIEVKPIAKISVDGSPKPLIISENFSGSVSDDNTKYSLVTNVDNMKIVASIDNPMPAGTKLMVKLSSSKAASAGPVDLSNAMTPLDVVRGIGRGSDVDQSISYTFAANQDIDEVAQQSRTVTLTLTN